MAHSILTHLHRTYISHSPTAFAHRKYGAAERERDIKEHKPREERDTVIHPLNSPLKRSQRKKKTTSTYNKLTATENPT